MAEGDREPMSPPGLAPTSRPALLEFFFDLAYVAAMIALTERLLANLTPPGAAEALVLLVPFALLWALTSWAGDTVDLNRWIHVPQLVWGTAGVLVMSAAVSAAYEQRGLLFVVAYLATHLGSGVYNLVVLARARAPRPVRSRPPRVLFWVSLAAVPWIVGALLPQQARLVLWTVAAAVEVLGVLLAWPAPWARQRLAPPPVQIGERVSERYRQFVIIALGVAIFLTGRAYGGSAHRLADTLALTVVFGTTVLIWRIYIHRAGELMTGGIAESANPWRRSQLTALVHLVLVSGILGTAAANELVIARPFGATPVAMAMLIFSGPALFLLGRLLLDRIVFARLDRPQIVGLVGLIVLAPTSVVLPPMMAALAVLAVLTGVAAVDLLLTRARPPTPATRAG